MTGPCNKEMQKVAKGTCLSVVHTGVNKKLSQTVIKDNYDATYNGSKVYYKTTKRFIQINHPKVRLPQPVIGLL